MHLVIFINKEKDGMNLLRVRLFQYEALSKNVFLFPTHCYADHYFSFCFIIKVLLQFIVKLDTLPYVRLVANNQVIIYHSSIARYTLSIIISNEAKKVSERTKDLKKYFFGGICRDVMMISRSSNSSQTSSYYACSLALNFETSWNAHFITFLSCSKRCKQLL